ncbi:MAG TPA: hypothetical protein VHB21_01665, partial [Minicystis sp.]|nr:hypothetical protein [Minicystis sp.]
MTTRAALHLVCAAAVALAAVLLAGPARAHQVGLSRGEYTLAGDTMTAELTFARGELSSAVADLDKNG